jgi:hypothetical protein
MPCAEAGWCAVPSAFLRYAVPLGISPEEAWLLLQLLDLKWCEGRSTFETLAERCRMSAEAVHQMLRRLEERGFLKFIPKYPRSEPNGAALRNGAAPKNSAAPPPVKAPSGWELDLSPFLQALNEYIMRDGDLNSGFLRLSSVRVEGG